jgi:hypothetical protein
MLTKCAPSRFAENREFIDKVNDAIDRVNRQLYGNGHYDSMKVELHIIDDSLKKLKGDK